MQSRLVRITTQGKLNFIHTKSSKILYTYILNARSIKEAWNDIPNTLRSRETEVLGLKL